MGNGQKSIDQLSFHERGQGPAIVLLHGLSRSKDHWFDYETMLAKHFRIIAIDLRGAGKSSAPCSWSLQIEDMAEDIAQVLDHLQINQAHVLGSSLGGMVAIAFALSFPERCASLTVMNSSIAWTETRMPRISWEAIKLLLKTIALKGDLYQINVAITDLVVGADCDTPKRAIIAEKLTDLARKQLPKPINVIKQLLAAHRFQIETRLSEVKVPTLVIQGSHDRFVPPVNSQALAERLPQAKLLTIAYGGHEMMFDRAHELLAAQLAWVENLALDIEPLHILSAVDT